MTNGLLRSWERRSHCQNNFGNAVPRRSRWKRSLAVTLARPSLSSSLQINNRFFTYASLYLWNQLPSSFPQPHSIHSSWFTSSCAYRLITVTIFACFPTHPCLTHPLGGNRLEFLDETYPAKTEEMGYRMVKIS